MGQNRRAALQPAVVARRRGHRLARQRHRLLHPPLQRPAHHLVAQHGAVIRVVRVQPAGLLVMVEGALRIAGIDKRAAHHHVPHHVRGVQAHRLLRMLHGTERIALPEQDELRAIGLRVCVARVYLDRPGADLQPGGQCRGRIVGPAQQEIAEAAARQQRPRVAEVRVAGDGSLGQRPLRRVRLAGAVAVAALAFFFAGLGQQVPGGHVAGALDADARRGGARDLGLDLADDALADFLLEVEHVGKVTVEGLAPEFAPRDRVDQPGCDPRPCPRPPHRTGDDISRLQRLGQRRQVALAALDRFGADHRKPTPAGKGRADILAQA